jgi:hypothetical protein
LGLGVAYVGTAYLTNTELADENAVYNIPGSTNATAPFLMD